MTVASSPGDSCDRTTCTDAGSGTAVVVLVDVVVVVGDGAAGPHAAASTPTTAIVAAQVSRRRSIGALPRMRPEAGIATTVTDH
jgi:hypothetical protein